ncbi:hypothetical protein [Clostridium massiliodielmoense]|uniref:hypothetical protein n=1 Tax=Clostridium massiliodielmoense TaxID=1776385 RepID=UPI000A26916B|nr:hypothetical protein [Clostridium massiliodielmoense]
MSELENESKIDGKVKVNNKCNDINQEFNWKQLISECLNGNFTKSIKIIAVVIGCIFPSSCFLIFWQFDLFKEMDILKLIILCCCINIMVMIMSIILSCANNILKKQKIIVQINYCNMIILFNEIVMYIISKSTKKRMESEKNRILLDRIKNHIEIFESRIKELNACKIDNIENKIYLAIVNNVGLALMSTVFKLGELYRKTYLSKYVIAYLVFVYLIFNYSEIIKILIGFTLELITIIFKFINFILNRIIVLFIAKHIVKRN